MFCAELLGHLKAEIYGIHYHRLRHARQLENLQHDKTHIPCPEDNRIIA